MLADIIFALITTLSLEGIAIPTPGLSACKAIMIDEPSVMSAGGYLHIKRNNSYWEKTPYHFEGVFRKLNNQIFGIYYNRIFSITEEDFQIIPFTYTLYDFGYKNNYYIITYDMTTFQTDIVVSNDLEAWTKYNTNLPEARINTWTGQKNNILKSLVWNDKIIVAYWTDNIWQSTDNWEEWELLNTTGNYPHNPILGIWTDGEYLYVADVNGLWKVDKETNCTKVIDPLWEANYVEYYKAIINQEEYPIIISYINSAEQSGGIKYQTVLYDKQLSDTFITLAQEFKPENLCYSDSTVYIPLQSDTKLPFLKYPYDYIEYFDEPVNAGTLKGSLNFKNELLAMIPDKNKIYKLDLNNFVWIPMEFTGLGGDFVKSEEFRRISTNGKTHWIHGGTKILVNTEDRWYDRTGQINWDDKQLLYIFSDYQNEGGARALFDPLAIYDTKDYGESWDPINIELPTGFRLDQYLAVFFYDPRNEGCITLKNTAYPTYQLWHKSPNSEDYILAASVGFSYLVGDNLIFPPNNPELVLWPTSAGIKVFNTFNPELPVILSNNISRVYTTVGCASNDLVYLLEKDTIIYWTDDVYKDWHSAIIRFPIEHVSYTHKFQMLAFGDDYLHLASDFNSYIIPIPTTSIPSILYAQPLIISPSVGAGPFRLARAFGNDLPTWSLFDIKGRLVGNGASMYIDPQRLQLTSGNYYVHSQSQVKKIVVMR